MTGENWDREVDVLVAGTGNGGLTAALCNWEMGATDVLLIEKGHKVGGTSATSGGGIVTRAQQPRHHPAPLFIEQEDP